MTPLPAAQPPPPPPQLRPAVDPKALALARARDEARRIACAIATRYGEVI